MRQKNNLSQLVTKDYLNKELGALEKSLRSEIKTSAEDTKNQLEETIIEVKDIILTTMDSFAKDIEINREDRDLAIHQTSQLNDTAEDHEKRIKNLEKTQQTV